MTPDPLPRAAAALGVSLVVASLMLPLVLHGWAFSPDVVDHLQIAHNWLHGSGFVSALLRAFNLEAGPPIPAMAVRPPVFTALAAIPLGLGATLSQVVWVNVLWTSAIAGAIAWVASRFMRLPAAIGAALVVGCSPLWVNAAIFPLTEGTSIAAYLLVLVTARRATTSAPHAALCAAATLLAWLTHPRLGALALAVFAALVWEGGLRTGWRSRTPWIYGLTFVAFQIAAQGLARAWTGLGIYSGYAIESLGALDVQRYGKEYVGFGDFFAENASEILRSIGTNAGLVADLFLMRPWALYLGWLIPFGILWALTRRPGTGVEQRISGLGALGFTLATVLNWVTFEPRYLTLPFVCGALCVLGMLDDASTRLERTTRVARALPIAAALLLVCAVALPVIGPQTLRAIGRYRASGTREPSSSVAAFCPYMDRDAVVASPRLFNVALFCGNAAMHIPTDLRDPGLRDRFFTERHPGYLLAPVRSRFEWFARDPRLRFVHHEGGLALWEVVDASPESRPWHAPPPLFCAGRPDDCVTSAASD